jgi:DNA polymerase III delta prime subunit
MDLYNEKRPKVLSECINTSKAIQSLEKMLGSKKTPNSMLFYGPSGVGKTTIARIVADEIGRIVKEEGEVDFRVEEVNAGTEGGIAKAREISEAMANSISIIGKVVQVFIIDEAQALRKEAQRAFLKPIEDNQEHTYAIFCSSEPELLLPAIKDRCKAATYRFYYPHIDEMKSLLIRIANEIRKDNSFDHSELEKSKILTEYPISVRSAIGRLQTYINSGIIGDSIDEGDETIEAFRKVISLLMKKKKKPEDAVREIYRIASSAGFDNFRNTILNYCVKNVVWSEKIGPVSKLYIEIARIMNPFLTAPPSGDILVRVHDITNIIENHIK